jgi:hypothetical protein
MMICCGMAVKRLGNIRSECEEDEGTTLKKETVTPIGKSG